jgi:hypothetical protein
MLMRRAYVYIAVATMFGLGIGLPLAFVSLQFHRSSYPPQDYASEQPSQHESRPIVGYIVKEPEAFGDRVLSDPVAVGTFVLAFITFAMVLVIGAQVRLVREEFNTTHRPRIRVRKVTIREPVLQSPLWIDYEIANVGDTVATVAWAEIAIEVPRDENHRMNMVMGEEPAPTTGRHTHMGPFRLRPGERRTIEADTDLGWAWEPRFARDKMVVSGVVFYKDALGIERHTEFERFNEWGSLRFSSRTNPSSDHDYED